MRQKKLPLLLLVARRCSNSQGGDPRTLRYEEGAAPCARCAKQPGAGTQAPRRPPCGRSAGWWLRCPANANSQRWGPQDPKRPGGPPFSWALVPYLALRAMLPLFCLRPPLPCPRAAAMTRWRGMNLQGFDNTRGAVRTPCAADRGKAARWWPNPVKTNRRFMQILPNLKPSQQTPHTGL